MTGMNPIDWEWIDGPTAYRVYQRDETGCADIALKLKAKTGRGESGTITCALLPESSRPGDAERTMQLHLDGKIHQGTFEKVPAGNYKLVVIAEGAAGFSATISHVAVGDLYLLAGQSNMEGVGKLIDPERPSRAVRCFYLDDRWGVAKDPLCWFNEAVDAVHWRAPRERRADEAKMERYFRRFGAGLGIRFGKEMYKYNGVPVGLIMCAHGGTSMKQWEPPAGAKRELPSESSMTSDSFYGSMMRRLAATGGRVKAVLWYQGESDAADRAQAAAFKKRFLRFVAALRADIGQPSLPILYAQLNTWLGDAAAFPHWNDIQLDQALVEAEIPGSALVSTNDLSLADAIHLDTSSLKRLGRRFAVLARGFCFGDETCARGPRPIDCRFADADRTKLYVAFEQVNGRLMPSKQIQGFQVANGDENVPIAECRRDKRDGSVVVLSFARPVPRRSVLGYGLGLNPVCNLRDSADLAAPVFRYPLD